MRLRNSDVLAAPVLPVRELQTYLATSPLQLDDGGRPRVPLAFIDLDAALGPHTDLAAATEAATHCQTVLVGVTRTGPPASMRQLVEALTCTLVTLSAESSQATVRVADIDKTCSDIAAMVQHAPRAALSLNTLMRFVGRLPVEDALVAESLAYSMLLAGREFAQWRETLPRAPSIQAAPDAVLLRREGNVLHVVLNRPERHNAFGRDMRDGLVEALDVALADSALTVRLSGNGDSFCSGGDLNEFGLAADPATAHLVRLEQSVAGRVHRCRDRVEVCLHGACIGAGVEIPSFAGRVVAAGDTYFSLPELGMGLIPGAGGTVGVGARIGRWRTAFLVLSGRRIDAETALAWGLVDAVVDA